MRNRICCALFGAATVFVLALAGCGPADEDGNSEETSTDGVESVEQTGTTSEALCAPPRTWRCRVIPPSCCPWNKPQTICGCF